MVFELLMIFRLWVSRGKMTSSRIIRDLLMAIMKGGYR